MTIQTFQLPVMARLPQADFVRRIWVECSGD